MLLSRTHPLWWRCVERCPWAVVLAESGSANPLAFAYMRISPCPPSLPGNAGGLLLRLPPEAKLRRGRGRRKTETAPFAARLSAAAALDRPARRSRPRVRRALSPAFGNPP